MNSLIIFEFCDLYTVRINKQEKFIEIINEKNGEVIKKDITPEQYEEIKLKFQRITRKKIYYEKYRSKETEKELNNENQELLGYLWINKIVTYGTFQEREMYYSNMEYRGNEWEYDWSDDGEETSEITM